MSTMNPAMVPAAQEVLDEEVDGALRQINSEADPTEAVPRIIAFVRLRTGFYSAIVIYDDGDAGPG